MDVGRHLAGAVGQDSTGGSAGKQMALGGGGGNGVEEKRKKYLQGKEKGFLKMGRWVPGKPGLLARNWPNS